MSTWSLDEDTREELVEFFETYYADETSLFIQGYPRDVRSLTIDYSDLAAANYDIATDYIEDHSQVNQWLKDSFSSYVNDLPTDLTIDPVESNYHIRVSGIPEEYTYGVNELRSRHGMKFVSVRGQLSNVSGSRSRITEAVFDCQRCNTQNRIPQPFGTFQKAGECQSCERNGPFDLNHSDSSYIDQVVCKLQQPPDEAATSGGQGQDITVFVEDDLTDPGNTGALTDYAGERVVVNGLLQFDDTDLQGQNPTPVVGKYLEAESIELESGTLSSVDIPEHKEEFTRLAQRDDVHEILRDSIAPELHAEPDLEKVLSAAVLYLFGGVRRDPEDGPTYRGDIHMLMVGDPGTAKSTIASNVNKLSPRSEFVSGTDVTGAGLTSAAVREDFGFGEAQWTLKPGVLPKANGGHAIIDEIDKADGNAAEKLHDALEGDQQIRTSKGGIQAKLNTRCGLLASGNPEYGRFEDRTSIPEQINLDPALVSRFDLLFVMRDEVDKEIDTKISSHVLTSIQEAGNGGTSTGSGTVAQTDGGVKQDEATSRPVSIDVFRAWVAYARHNVYPTLPDGRPKERLIKHYNDLRGANKKTAGSTDSDDSAIPATARDLMASVRLAEASARCRLSETITIEDVENALSVLDATIGNRFDSDTGEFDANIVDNSVTKSQKDRIDTIKNLLSEMQRGDEYEKTEGVPFSEFKEAASEYGIEPSKIEHEIEQLKRRGEVYEPRSGTVWST